MGGGLEDQLDPKHHLLLRKRRKPERKTAKEPHVTVKAVQTKPRYLLIRTG